MKKVDRALQIIAAILVVIGLLVIFAVLAKQSKMRLPTPAQSQITAIS